MLTMYLRTILFLNVNAIFELWFFISSDESFLETGSLSLHVKSYEVPHHSSSCINWSFLVTVRNIIMVLTRDHSFADIILWNLLCSLNYRRVLDVCSLPSMVIFLLYYLVCTLKKGLFALPSRYCLVGLHLMKKKACVCLVSHFLMKSLDSSISDTFFSSIFLPYWSYR